MRTETNHDRETSKAKAASRAPAGPEAKDYTGKPANDAPKPHEGVMTPTGKIIHGNEPTVAPNVGLQPGKQNWAIFKRPIGDQGDGVQDSPSVYQGSETEVQQYVKERTVQTQQAGAGPAFEFVYKPA